MPATTARSPQGGAPPSVPPSAPPAPDAAQACAADLIEVLPVVMNAVRVAMRRHVSGGLSVPQFRCLNFVDQRPGSSLSAVAAFMGTSLPTASANADRLVRAGLLEAVPAAADRRRSELRVTAAGRSLLDGMRELARGELALRLCELTAPQLAGLGDSMALLKQAFGRAPLPADVLAAPQPPGGPGAR